jgi:hypothetical protein
MSSILSLSSLYWKHLPHMEDVFVNWRDLPPFKQNTFTLHLVGSNLTLANLHQWATTPKATTHKLGVGRWA